MAETMVTPIHMTVLHWQDQMIREFRQRRGMLNPSEALRAILTEWRDLTGFKFDVDLLPSAELNADDPMQRFALEERQATAAARQERIRREAETV